MTTKLSILEAAKLAGVSRAHFYKAYIKSGKISIDRDEKGKPSVDVSEVLRVFGRLHERQTYQTANDSQSKHEFSTNLEDPKLILERLKGLQALLEAKEQELAGYREREKTFYRLLEVKVSKKKRWWLF